MKEKKGWKGRNWAERKCGGSRDENKTKTLSLKSILEENLCSETCIHRMLERQRFGPRPRTYTEKLHFGPRSKAELRGHVSMNLSRSGLTEQGSAKEGVSP